MSTEYERRKNNYDTILFRVKKGKRGEYQQAAQDLNIGFWELIQSGIEEFIWNHAGEKFPTEVKPESISAADRRLLDEFNQLPVDAQKSLLKFLKAINESKEGGEND